MFFETLDHKYSSVSTFATSSVQLEILDPASARPTASLALCWLSIFVYFTRWVMPSYNPSDTYSGVGEGGCVVILQPIHLSIP